MSVSVLDRPVYGMAQVDRLLGLPRGTAQRWIDGYTRTGRRYPPVVRDETTGDELVTWGEFVETRLLSLYRDKGVPMLRMRPAVERMREEFGVPYPLAHFRPLVGGRELLLEIQDRIGLERQLRLVVARSGQAVLTPPAEEFLETVEGPEDPEGVVEALRPLGRASPVVIDPLRQFGEPVVRSVPVDAIVEEFRAGDDPGVIAEGYELPLDHVLAAIRYALPRSA